MLSIGPREMAAALRVLARGDLARYSAGGSSQTARFEQEIAQAMGASHALAVNSGTSALVCALVGLGIGPGDEVLVPAYTWVSSAAAPLAVGAIPVLVDIDASATIDPVDIKRKITPYTKAIIPVHMINLVCDMDAIMKIAAEHDLVVIEDACQAVGVRYHGRRVGTIGHAGAFSFNQMKNLKCGEGGLVLTNDARVHARASMYHDVGSYEREGWTPSDVPLIPGVNYRMPELSAAILRPQLRRLDKQLRRRRELREVLLDVLEESSFEYHVCPHHDPDDAVGFAVAFDDPAQAERFGAIRGARRLIDSGRHVYTNWQSVLARNPVHPELDPYRWAQREIELDETTCRVTLEIMARTCTFEVPPELPPVAFRQMAKRLIK
jgi:dTDP-4-amino-4,6-dideoxygalactose transaminase